MQDPRMTLRLFLNIIQTKNIIFIIFFFCTKWHHFLPNLATRRWFLFIMYNLIQKKKKYRNSYSKLISYHNCLGLADVVRKTLTAGRSHIFPHIQKINESCFCSSFYVRLLMQVSCSRPTNPCSFFLAGGKIVWCR